MVKGKAYNNCIFSFFFYAYFHFSILGSNKIILFIIYIVKGYCIKYNTVERYVTLVFGLRVVKFAIYWAATL